MYVPFGLTFISLCCTTVFTVHENEKKMRKKPATKQTTNKQQQSKRPYGKSNSAKNLYEKKQKRES